MEKFTLRYSHFRDIWVRAELVTPSWYAGLIERFPGDDFVTMEILDGSSYYVFKCAGENPSVTTSTSSNAPAVTVAPFIRIDS